MAITLPNGRNYFTDLNGNPLVGGKLHTYQPGPGITTPKNTYFDADATIPHTNPIILDARGEATIFWDGGYNVRLEDALSGLIYSVEEINTDPSAASLDALLRADLANKTNPALGPALIGYDPTLIYTQGTLGWSEASRREWNCADYPWLAKFDGATDDTAAILACFVAVYNAGGGTVVLPAGTAKVTNVAYTLIAARTVNIRGAGAAATVLQQIAGSVGPVLDIAGGPAILDLFATYSNFTISGNANAQHGLRATRFATSTFENLRILNCDVGFEAVGCLVVTHNNPYYQFNNIGYRSRKSGAIYSNLVIFNGGKVGGGATFGMDIGDASGVEIYGTDLSGSGTAGNVNTGGVILRNTNDDEVGYGFFLMVGGWFEGNKGWQIRSEACPGMSITLIDVNIAASEAGRALDLSAGIKTADIINCIAGSPGDTMNFGATPTNVLSGTSNIYIGTAINYLNASDAGGVRPFEVRTAKIGTGGLKIDPTAFVSDTGIVFTQGNVITQFRDGAGAGGALTMYAANGVGGNAAATVYKLSSNSVTGRSINAGGTVNVGGADYAEYETKRTDCATIAAGDIVGFDSAGLLTDKWALAVSFGIKSTDPSFVGGDRWGGGITDPVALEAARQKVDRIAYSGKVPVNLTGATPGQWVDAAANGQGIKAVTSAVRGPSTVGRVRSILPDGRALVVVIV